jgi:hypothetical protein
LSRVLWEAVLAKCAANADARGGGGGRDRLVFDGTDLACGVVNSAGVCVKR